MLASLLLAAFSGLQAEESLDVLDAVQSGVAPRKMLGDNLLGQAKIHFDQRRAAIAALKTPQDLLQRQAELKAKFIGAIGGFPDRTPLNPQSVGRVQGDGFHIEKLIYESRPAHHVTAILYLPDGTPPFPGVLMPCGHSENGKAAELYQRACILMAKNGIAVLCYDPIGQGERIQLLDALGKPAIAGSTSEHTMVGVGALLVGGSTAGYRIWDGIRSLDYLVSRPEIDPGRLGCTGNSGGGTLTAYLMALDDRILAAAPSCYITSLERLFATIGPQDAEQNITGQVAFGMEHADYVTMRAPRPTLICVGTQDYFDIDGAWTTFREAKLLYGLLGHGERVDLFEYNDKHGFSQPRREAAARWLRRWLLQKDDAVVESPFPVFKDAELQCTRTGQVLEDLKGRSAFDLNLHRGQELADRRTAALVANGGDERQQGAKFLKDLPGLVRRVIAAEAPLPEAKMREAAIVERESYRIRKLVFATEPGISVPGLLFEPRAAAPASFTIYLHGEGKAVDAAPGGPIEKLVNEGNRVLALDLRGMGETAPAAAASGRANYFGSDSREAFLGLHLNRPLLGQRVLDLLAVAAKMADQAPRGFHLVAIGSAGPIALHAAALEPRFSRVTLERSVLSWSAVVGSPLSINQLTNVVPGVLAQYDLPDLASLLAPRPLTIRGAVDGAGKPVSQAILDDTYSACRKTFLRLDSAKQLVLEAGE